MQKLALFLMMWGPVAWAETLPSLDAMPAPQVDNMQLGDPGFVAFLTAMGDTDAALQESLHQAYANSGEAEASALLTAAKLAFQNDKKTLSINLLNRFNAKFPNHSRKAEALYLFSRAVPAAQRQAVLTAMQQHEPNSPYTAEALYSAAYDAARATGTLPVASATDPRMAQLADKLQELQAHLPHPLVLAMVPGAAYFYAGDIFGSVTALCFILLMLLAIFSALRRYHYAYVLVWLGGLVGVFAYSLTTGQQVLAAAQTATRHTAMDSWSDLYPKDTLEVK
ncbi:MAG: hypothetical protein WAX89_03320 [Alphaproteobacteria bacterium]